MRAWLIGLGVFCCLLTARMVEAAVKAPHATSRAPSGAGHNPALTLLYWVIAIALAVTALSLFRRAMRREYRWVPPQQSTRDWDSYIAPKPPRAAPSPPRPRTPPPVPSPAPRPERRLTRDDIESLREQAEWRFRNRNSE